MSPTPRRTRTTSQTAARDGASLAEPCEWFVETDRGPTSFVLNSDEHVRKLGQDRALILDSHGLRYLVPDAKQLDAHSRRLLSRYLS